MDNRIIYLDIDGVLANWTKSMCLGLGYPYPKNTEFETSYWLRDHFSRKQIDDVADSVEFWQNIELYPWADEIVEIVDKCSDKWFFLTKPMPFSSCWHGKALWIMKHFPKHLDKLIIITGSKSKCCQGGDTILIDDCKKNIFEWEKSLGSSFYWKEITSDYKYPSERLDKLERFLNNYQHEL